jgi:hypothetical protein
MKAPLKVAAVQMVSAASLNGFAPVLQDHGYQLIN